MRNGRQEPSKTESSTGVPYLPLPLKRTCPKNKTVLRNHDDDDIVYHLVINWLYLKLFLLNITLASTFLNMACCGRKRTTVLYGYSVLGGTTKLTAPIPKTQYFSARSTGGLDKPSGPCSAEKLVVWLT